MISLDFSVLNAKQVNQTLFSLYGDLVAVASQKQRAKEVVNSNYPEECSSLTSIHSDEMPFSHSACICLVPVSRELRYNEPLFDPSP